MLADDHAAVREALAVLVNSQPDMEVIAQAGNGDEAIERAREARPDIAVLDVSMPAMSGLEVTTVLRDAIPTTRILMLTRHGEYHHVQELLRAGANGYVLKQSSSEELLQAIRVVASGKSFLDPLVAGQITQHYAADTDTHPRPIREEPSPRELEVLRLLARGYANREIAAELGISVKTVDAHKANGMSKLGMSSRIELVRFAILQGWLRES
ncbi:MAG TPA: response regulator transcription factor [Vicinamibacterales bacterium]|nr:response regulator transcription factor [Vicinamibacterales bacterium]